MVTIESFRSTKVTIVTVAKKWLITATETIANTTSSNVRITTIPTSQVRVASKIVTTRKVSPTGNVNAMISTKT